MEMQPQPSRCQFNIPYSVLLDRHVKCLVFIQLQTKKSAPHPLMLWCNSAIRIGGKPILWNHIVTRGLLFVQQL